MLAQAQDGLDHDVPVPVAETGDPSLSAALQVIELLTVTMSAAAKQRLGAEAHQAFVAELKRAVADAVGDPGFRPVNPPSSERACRGG
jgi:hypothetical protein